MNLAVVSSVIFAALAVAIVPNDPRDPASVTSLSKRISLIPGAPNVNIESKDYSAWMKKCCNRTKYDAVHESRSQNAPLVSNNALDRIIIAIKDILTDIFNRARYTDLEFDTNFNKVAAALNKLLLKSPELKESIEKICHDVHVNMCQIKPNLHKAGMFYYSLNRIGGYGSYLTEKKYGNHQIERSRSVLIHMPFVKATKIDVGEAIKTIDRTNWLQKCTMNGIVNEMPPTMDSSNDQLLQDIDNDLNYLAGALNTVTAEFENSAKIGEYRNFDRDKNIFDAVATELAKIYNKNYNNPQKMFHVDCICHDMYNILTLMRATDSRKPIKTGKRLFGMF